MSLKVLGKKQPDREVTSISTSVIDINFEKLQIEISDAQEN